MVALNALASFFQEEKDQWGLPSQLYPERGQPCTNAQIILLVIQTLLSCNHSVDDVRKGQRLKTFRFDMVTQLLHSFIMPSVVSKIIDSWTQGSRNNLPSLSRQDEEMEKSQSSTNRAGTSMYLFLMPTKTQLINFSQREPGIFPQYQKMKKNISELFKNMGLATEPNEAGARLPVNSLAQFIRNFSLNPEVALCKGATVLCGKTKNGLFYFK